MFLLLGGAVNLASAAIFAAVEPPWIVSRHVSPLAGYQHEYERTLRDGVDFPERFPRLMRRSRRAERSWFGATQEAYYGDSAMGPPGDLAIELQTVRSGWPLRALSGRFTWVRSGNRSRWGAGSAIVLGAPGPSSRNTVVYNTLVPLEPMPAGCLVNTLLWAVMLAVVQGTRVRCRERVRLRRHRCPRCAYPFGTSSVCTECGQAMTEQWLMLRPDAERCLRCEDR